MKHSTHARGAAALSLVAVTGLLLAGCSGAANSATAQDSKAEITVWTDAARQASFEAYQKSHPKVKMKVQLYDANSLLTKIQLANRVGKGWPDLVFDPNPNDAAALASSNYKYTADLKNVIPADVQKNFGTSLDQCTIGGALVCLKNDLAQTVLWYNKPLLEKFGYSVPATWEDYAALGNKVAAEHPGYVIGAVGSSYVNDDYLWPSGCPLQDVVNATETHINTADPACTRMTKLLDPLVQNSSVSKFGVFDPEMSKLGKDGKILMLVGASWFGDFVFKPASGFGTPEGVLAAAPMPKWEGKSTGYSGASGGGIFLVSAHSKNIAGAAAIAQWMATSNTVQAKAPTYPAYGPAAKAWSTRLANDSFYAENPFPVLQQAANQINPSVKLTRYAVDSSVSATLVTAVQNGKTLTSALPDLQSQLTGLAQSTGYAVVTKH